MARAGLLLPCALALAAGGCGSPSSEGAPPKAGDAVPVTIATVGVRDVPLEVRAVGTVSAYSTVAVRSQVDGLLAEVHFQEGQEVRQGDLLFVIDPRPFEAALREAEAKLAQDRATAAQASTEATRFERLHKEGVASVDEWDQARTRAEAARAASAADEATVETARIRLQYCSITSPIDGRVGALLVHRGNTVKQRETTLAVVNQIRPTYVEFSVPQQELPAIRSHMAAGPLTVTATVAGAAEDPVVGTLGFVDNAVDTATGTVRLKAEFANEREILWPGAFVGVALRIATVSDALVVPGRAIQAGQAGPFAYVVRTDGTVEPRQVEVGPTLGDEVVVTRGLAGGETVVTDGQLRLAPGSRVQTGTTAPAPDPEAS